MSEAVAVGTPSGKLWSVPFSRNPYFLGRDALLESLRRSFLGAGDKSNVQVVHGLGGVGKTQLALEYAHRHRGDYSLVWWLPAEDATALGMSYLRLAQAMGMRVPDNASLDLVRHNLRRVLAGRSDYLLIFDNAPGPADVRNYLPTGGRGHVLITSRNPVWGDVGQAFQLRPLERADSVKLLLLRSGAKESESAANTLAQALGDLPLAVDQAAACLEQTKQPFAEYLASFENYWGELLRRGRPSADYPETAAMVLELSLRQVEEFSSAATNLMNLCAFLAPDEIPFSLLREAAPVMQHPVAGVCTDPIKLDRAVGSLLRFSLLDATATGLTIHRLVAAIARDRMSAEDRAKWAGIALRVANTFRFDSSDVYSWGKAGMAVPHVLAAVGHCRKLQIELPTCAELLNDAGRYLHKRAQVVQAKEVLEQALDLHKDVYGERHPKVAGVSNNLGRVLKDLGRDLDAIALFEEALTLDESAYGSADPHVATVINNYGISLRNTGDFETARKQFEWALNVYTSTYGKQHAKTAAATNNLGYVLKDLGMLPEAMEHFREALRTAELTLGSEHPTVACILYNVAETLRAEGKAAEALPMAERALVIDEAAYGPSHPDVARDLVELADCQVLIGREAEAKENYTRALSMLRPVYGDHHQRTMGIRKRIEGIGG